MAADKLNQLLKKLQIPEPNKQAVEMAREKARLAFQHRVAFKNDIPTQSLFWTWSLTSLTSALLILLLVLTRSESGQIGIQAGVGIAPSLNSGFEMIAWEAGLKRDAKVIREMGNLFPGELKAVVEEGGTQRVVLGGGGQSQPVAVELRKEGESIRVLSFSGQELEVKIGGKAFKMEILLTPKNDVLLSGDNFAVKSEKGKEANAAGVQVRAAPI